MTLSGLDYGLWVLLQPRGNVARKGTSEIKFSPELWVVKPVFEFRPSP